MKSRTRFQYPAQVKINCGFGANMSSSRLVQFQSKIHQELEPYRKISIVTSQKLNEQTMDYLNSPVRKSAANFDPHITLGFSNTIPKAKFKPFYLDEINIFEIGNNGTCIALKQ
jgi:hypothetical protein